jgi:ATP-dependent protease ClpP protease subunit
MPNLTALLAEGESLRPSAKRHERPLGAPDRADLGYRVERPQAAADGAVETAEAGTDPVKLFIYSDIGGWFGVWPEDVIGELAGITGDIELHLHSPGGDAFDGVAIYNAFKDYDEDPKRGAVNVEIDGLAASAASVIAMAGRKIKMKRGSIMMIHDAWGFAQGPAEDMGKMQTFLDKISGSIAEVYADKAGGTAEDWRTAMRAESWYTDREAVEAGLADKIETQAAAAKNKWDLAVFNYAGRDAAPTPAMPAGRHPMAGAYTEGLVDLEALARMAADEAEGPDRSSVLDALKGAQALKDGKEVTPAQAAALMYAAAQRAKARTTPEEPQTPAAAQADGPTHTEGDPNMPFDPAKIREALGLGPDADDAKVQAAWAAAFTPAPTPPAEPGNSPTDLEGLSALAAKAASLGVRLIDPGQLDEMRAMAARGQQAYNAQQAGERDAVIDAAVRSGRIALSRVDDWKKSWDAECKVGGTGEKTRELIESLSPNLVPMEAQGYSGMGASNETDTRLYDLYPEMKPQGGRR